LFRSDAAGQFRDCRGRPLTRPLGRADDRAPDGNAMTMFASSTTSAMYRSILVLTAVTIAGCASNPQGGTAAVPHAGPAAMGPAASTDTSTRPRPYPVFEPRGFVEAVEAGTRTRSGAPGSSYWQQRSRYRIEATYDPASGRLEGHSTITYHNRSPDDLPALFLHLHGNLFDPEGVSNNPVPTSGGMTLTRVALRGEALQPFARGNPRGYRVNGTILGFPTGAPVASGDSVVLEIDWRYTVPPNGAPRGGRDSTVAYVSYWYPQMAVYDDVNGWQIDPYLGNAEFYMGYGDYDVAITLPAGYLIGA